MPHDDARVVIHHLIAEGETLQDANDKDPGEDAFVLWMNQVREILTALFGSEHGVVAQAEEAAQGPTKLRRDPGQRPVRYFRVRIIRVLEVLRRVGLALQRQAHAQQTP